MVGDLLLLRHMASILFEFYNLLHIDLIVYNASGWDRVDKFVKVSLHVVAPDILSTADRLKMTREHMIAHLLEHSKSGPLKELYDRFIKEHDDNTWFEVSDKTTTNDGNGFKR